MSLLNLVGMSTAYAADAAPAATHSHQGGFLSMLPMLVLILLVFYFLLIRPQQKRSKSQKTLLESVAIGDEVVTIGGIVGRVAKLRDSFIVLAVSKEVEITLRKTAIESMLPKGTMETD